jgi:hypothetical protein
MDVPQRDGGDETWIGQEPVLGQALRSRLARLARRGRATWFIWAPLAIAAAIIVTVRDFRHALYEATVVLRIAESNVQYAGTDVSGSDVNAHAVRDGIENRALTNQHLTDLLLRHAREFPDVRTSPAEAVADLRLALNVAILDDDFIEDRRRDDPPRSIRLAVSFKDARPAVALTIARELAELIVSSTLSLEAQALAREEAAATTAVAQAQTRVDTEPLDATGGGKDALAEAAAEAAEEAARDRLRAMVNAAGRTRLASQAGERGQTLAFDILDAGREPPVPTKLDLGLRGVAASVVALLAALLLAGAFDPRILDRQDVSALGLVVLGETPALPSQMVGPRAAAANAPAASTSR